MSPPTPTPSSDFLSPVTRSSNDMPDTDRSWKGRLVRLKRSNTIWIFGVLVVLLVAFTIKAPGLFNTGANFRNILIDTSSLLLLAIGQNYVIITSGIVRACR